MKKVVIAANCLHNVIFYNYPVPVKLIQNSRNAIAFPQHKMNLSPHTNPIFKIYICYQHDTQHESSLPSKVNSFIPNAPFLYPLKTSENRKV